MKKLISLPDDDVKKLKDILTYLLSDGKEEEDFIECMKDTSVDIKKLWGDKGFLDPDEVPYTFRNHIYYKAQTMLQDLELEMTE